jgi:hypothetical protein
MNVSMTYKMNEAQTAAAVAGLRKFELMRATPALVISVLGTIACNAVGETTGVIICGAVALILACLTANWLRIVARVRKTAHASTQPTSISISDEGLTVTRAEAPASTIRWQAVSHCTNTAGTWIFALKGRREAVLLPQEELDPAQREQIARLLATWPKRRYRSTSW